MKLSDWFGCSPGKNCWHRSKIFLNENEKIIVSASEWDLMFFGSFSALNQTLEKFKVKTPIQERKDLADELIQKFLKISVFE